MPSTDHAAQTATKDKPPKLHPVEIHVNNRPVTVPDKEVTGLQIKQAAVAQGVPIQLDFSLREKRANGRDQVVGDRDLVKVEPSSRFEANDGDDNS